MAIIAPMAEWKPFTGKGHTALTHDIVCAHTMVGKLLGSWNWANGAGRSYWHFGLGADGRLLQCQGLEYRSAANLEGNYHVIPIETEDGYPDGKTSNAGQVWAPWSGSNVPAWTTAQINQLVDVITWLCKRFNIPPVLIPDTKPGRRGLAYHRQGIDPWRISGGEKWSLSTGKVCPGDRRLAQFVNIVVPRVAAAVAGTTPQPPPEDPDMAYYAIITAPNMVSRLSVDGALYAQPAAELTETIAAYKKAGYTEKHVAFAEADDMARYVHGHPSQYLEEVQTELAAIKAAVTAPPP